MEEQKHFKSTLSSFIENSKYVPFDFKKKEEICNFLEDLYVGVNTLNLSEEFKKESLFFTLEEDEEVSVEWILTNTCRMMITYSESGDPIVIGVYIKGKRRNIKTLETYSISEGTNRAVSFLRRYFGRKNEDA